MPEMGELIQVPDIVDDEWECPFPHEEDPKKVTNSLTNNATTLGNNMDKGKSTSKREPTTEKIPHPEYDWSKPDGGGITLSEDGPSEFRMGLNPHHLIPGEASLPKSQLMDFISESPAGRIKSDIGYVVNGSQNGQWLPSNNAVKEWGKMTKPREDGVSRLQNQTQLGNYFLQQDYAFLTMEFCCAQFHDAHPDYNGFVIKCLNKIFLKCWFGVGKCDVCKTKKPLPPPYELIERLNAVSSRLRAYLLYPYQDWRAPVYTSAWALAYAKRHILRGPNA